jgi:hypothetical protein
MLGPHGRAAACGPRRERPNRDIAAMSTSGVLSNPCPFSARRADAPGAGRYGAAMPRAKAKPRDGKGPVPEPLPFDRIYRKMLGRRATVRDLLANHLAQPRGPLPAALVRALDMRTVRRLPTDWVTKNFRDRRGDVVVAIDFRKAARRAGWPERLFLHMEHQSTPDGRMLFRFFEYGCELSDELAASGALGANGDCPILCVLVYSGRKRWTVPSRTTALGPLPPALAGEPPLPERLAAFFPRGYHRVDMARLGAEPLIPGCAISLMAGLEHAGLERLRALLRDALDHTWPVLDRAQRATMAGWVLLLAAHRGIETTTEELMELAGVERVGSQLLARIDEEIAAERAKADRALARGMERGIAEGTERGIAQGMELAMAAQREGLRSQAAHRFGGRTAARLAALLERIGSPAALSRAGIHLVASDDAEDLLRRVAALARDGGNGNGAPPA